MDKQREAFEAWAKKPPREFYLARHPDAAAWPGNYKDYHVECAWQAWQAATQAKWLPIETAPSDRPFLGVLDCAGERIICTMRLAVAKQKNSVPDNGDFHRERVTHWMPLPPEPKP